MVFDFPDSQSLTEGGLMPQARAMAAPVTFGGPAMASFKRSESVDLIRRA